MDNQPLGYWEYTDLKDFLPPEAYPQKLEGPGYYLSRLDEQGLRQLAQATGLDYHRLETPQALEQALLVDNLAARRVVASDIRWVLALAALVLLLLTRILPFRNL
jgi:mxaL protein